MKKKKKKRQNIQELWDSFKRSKTHNCKIKGDETDNGAGEIFKIILAKTFLKLKTNTELQIQQAKKIHTEQISKK